MRLKPMQDDKRIACLTITSYASRIIDLAANPRRYNDGQNMHGWTERFR